MRLILFAGLPGTGKSTLAETLAQTSGIPVFSLDWLLGALTPFNILTNDNAAEIGYTLIETLVKRQFMMGQSAILDTPAHTTQLRTRWMGTTDQFDVEVYKIETICSDQDLHRSRVESRKRNIPGWHEITWKHVEKMRSAWESWDEHHLIVDAVDSLESNLDKIQIYISGATNSPSL
jgi:predicted kinase